MLIAAAFVYATASAWRAQESSGLSCGTLPADAPHTYIQYSVKDQAVEGPTTIIEFRGFMHCL